jgi:hypothetical protein
LAILIPGCDMNNGVLRRAAGDYFPMPIGAEWTYRYQDGTTSRLAVTGDTSVLNLRCRVVERDYRPLCWLKTNGELREYVEYLVNVNGIDYPLEQEFRRYYQYPLVLGNAWSEEFQDTVLVLGESIPFRHSITGQIIDDTTVSVRAGSFTGCYVVRIEEVILRPDTVRRLRKEWFAPDVGLVLRTEGQDTIELVAYSIP